jgi:prepilin-type N-terminal cleavage/methylation domain-containing protein
MTSTAADYPRPLRGASRPRRSAGFTLLEVIVALAITGFLLGGLFTLLAGSKQLSWRSEASLVRAIDARARINFALLENEFNAVEPVLENDRYAVRPGEVLEDPERKTQAISYALETYEVISDERDEVITGTRWLQLELPR